MGRLAPLRCYDRAGSPSDGAQDNLVSPRTACEGGKTADSTTTGRAATGLNVTSTVENRRHGAALSAPAATPALRGCRRPPATRTPRLRLLVGMPSGFLPESATPEQLFLPSQVNACPCPEKGPHCRGSATILKRTVRSGPGGEPGLRLSGHGSGSEGGLSALGLGFHT